MLTLQTDINEVNKEEEKTRQKVSNRFQNCGFVTRAK